ncbi:MAG: hypothetical protein M1281_06760 [Chloroflexi bacterium]|nr:hypothetical protein [Chloroflexota bacterium]
MDLPELDALLSKYRLSFHWNATGKKWWLISQAKNGSLVRSEYQPSEDILSAQAAAIKYIQNLYG